MTDRINLFAVESDLLKTFITFSHEVEAAGLEKSLIELVKIRASQLNSCAICLHMHTRDARKLGETEERIFMLNAWRESPLYTSRERAALAWTETLTTLAATGAPDEIYALVKAEFTDQQSIALTMLINVINSWNRLGVGYRRTHPVKVTAAPDAVRA
ncbi:MAG TPA: carboxymuconolactone decarboxylase family protein [Polyangiales bacterium]|nr:carboxymuconolactone decarboxylase family protein [Polyangiales bacterium]